MKDTQSSAGVPVGAGQAEALLAALDAAEEFEEAPGIGYGEHILDFALIRATLARITELEAHIAAEPDRIREVVERCAKVADDYVADGEPDGHGARGEYYAAQSIAAAIRAQEIKP